MPATTSAEGARRVPEWRGQPVTPRTIVAAWQRGTDRFRERSRRIVEARDLRRGTLTVALSPELWQTHPEVARSSLSVLPQRESLERDLVAKAGSAEPKPHRAALNATEREARHAEELEAYVREVAASAGGVPFQTLIEKGVEDGEHGLVAFPADLDPEGYPDFYDRLDERAVDALPAAERAAYKPDPNRPGTLARYDDAGNRVVNPRYDRGERGTSAGAHADAVRRYLLEHQASVLRVIPALDCVPILTRGRGRRRWECAALIERTLVEPDELEWRYGWAMLGDRLLVPHGFDASVGGISGQYYLYALYYVRRDDDGRERTVCCYTVGGSGTWLAGAPEQDRERDSVACIDLLEDRGLSGRFFDYVHYLHTSDDDPDWYARPYLWFVKNRILNLESLETAMNAATQLNAYTGHFQEMDGASIEALDRIDPEAVVDAQTHLLRRARLPGVGEIEPSTGRIVPALQAQVGPDAWRLHASYQQSLLEATAVDSPAAGGPSGNAMMVSESIGAVAKRQVREAALWAWEWCVEKDLRIRQAAFEQYDVRWPIATRTERAIGTDMVDLSEVAEWDPAWIGDGNYAVTGVYDQEMNLARADLEISGYVRGVRALKHVSEAFGDADVMALRVELAKDALWKDPASQELLRQTVDRLRGMDRQVAAAQLQQQGKLTRAGVPGAPAGVPTAMLNRVAGGQGAALAAMLAGGPGAAPTTGPGAGGPSLAASARGGIQAGQMSTARAAQNVAAAMGAGGG